MLFVSNSADFTAFNIHFKTENLPSVRYQQLKLTLAGDIFQHHKIFLSFFFDQVHNITKQKTVIK